MCILVFCIFTVYRYLAIRYTSIITVCWFAGIKFFVRYRYQYDKNTFFSILLRYIAQLYTVIGIIFEFIGLNVVFMLTMKQGEIYLVVCPKRVNFFMSLSSQAVSCLSYSSSLFHLQLLKQ